MTWRILLLTYPVWGSFLGFGLWSHFFPLRSVGGERLLLAFVLPTLLVPLPVWLSQKMGLGTKLLSSLGLYAYAYVSFFIMRFGVACAVLGFSCAMG